MYSAPFVLSKNPERASPARSTGVKAGTPIILCLGLGVIAALGFSTQVGFANAATNILINVVLVVGLYVFSGPSGILSFGHAAFAAIGGYAAALMALPVTLKATMLGDLPQVIADNQYTLFTVLLTASVLGGSAALLTGGVLLRLNGLHAGIATLALLVIVNVVIGQWTPVTNGPGSLISIPRWTTPVVAYGCVVLVVVLAWVFQNSRTGLTLIAAREDHLAARGSGVRVYRVRLIAFCLSGFIMGLGGALYALRVTVLSPSTFYLDMTLLLIAMLIVGGIRSLTGAITGAVVLGVLGEALRQLERGFSLGGIELPSVSGLGSLGVAACLLVFLILRPKGLTAGREVGTFRGFSRPGRTGRKARKLFKNTTPEED